MMVRLFLERKIAAAVDEKRKFFAFSNPKTPELE